MIANHASFLLFLMAFSGILFLYFYSLYMAPQTVSLSELKNAANDSTFSIKARVESFAVKDRLFIFLNDGTARVQAVKFDPSIEDISLLQENRFIELIARTDLFNGKKQLIVLEMKEWN